MILAAKECSQFFILNLRHFSAEIHGDLSWKNDFCISLGAFDVIFGDMEVLTDGIENIFWRNDLLFIW